MPIPREELERVHYPRCLAGAIICRARCVCGWEGPRHRSSKSGIAVMMREYGAHIDGSTSASSGPTSASEPE